MTLFNNVFITTETITLHSYQFNDNFSTGTMGGDDVVQEPTILWKPKASSADMNCTHNKGISYYQMYWYRQRPGETMSLIVFTVANSKPEFGDVKENKFEAHKK